MKTLLKISLLCLAFSAGAQIMSRHLLPKTYYILQQSTNIVVNAGADRTITNLSSTLTGTVSGVPTFFSVWSQDSGPTGISIATPGNLSSGVSFSTNGIYVFRLYAQSGDSFNFDTVSYVVNAASVVPTTNSPPTISTISPLTWDENTSSSTTAFTIGDPNDAVGTLALTSQSSNPSLIPPAGILLGGSGANRTLQLVPTTNQFGTATITITVTDPHGSSRSTSMVATVTYVNTPPTITSSGPQSTPEDTPKGISFSVGDRDTPVGSLIMNVIVTTPGYIQNTVFGGSGATRTATISPVLNANGSTLVALIVTDGGGLKATNSFLFTIGSTPDPPVVGAISTKTTLEDTPTALIFFYVNDPDTAVNNLVLSATSSDFTKVAVNGFTFGGSNTNRTLVVTPVGDANGSVQITVSVSDGSSTVSTSFTLNITPVNDPPVIGTIPSITSTNWLPVSANFTVFDKETPLVNLILSATTDRTDLFPPGTISFTGSGTTRTITVDPVGPNTGSANVTVTLSDGSASVTRTFVVNISTTEPPENEPPTVSCGFSDINIAEDTQTQVLNFTFSDDNTPAGQLVISVDSLPTIVPNDPQHLILTRTGAGTATLIVKPGPNLNGQALTHFYVTDQQGLTATCNFYVNVLEVNDRPQFTTSIPNQTIPINGTSGALSFTMADVEDPASDLVNVVTSSNPALIPNNPANLSVVGSGFTRTLQITPASGATGSSTITLGVTDSGNLSTNMTFTVTVGSQLATYPLDPMQGANRILPTGSITLAPGTSTSITACKGEYEPASFVLRPSVNFSSVLVSPGNLTGPGIISSNNLDVKWVKVWYQAGPATDTFVSDPPVWILTPELLLKDDALVNVDTAQQKNFLRLNTGYFDITTPSSRISTSATAFDAATLQPVNISANNNKQIMVTVRVPTNAVPGNYSGSLTVTAAGQPNITLTINLNVPNFDLAQSSLDYGLYYKGILDSATQLNSDRFRSSTATAADYTNMFAHGIKYPAFYYTDYSVLDLQRNVGMPTDKLFTFSDPRANVTDGITALDITTRNNAVHARTGWGSAEVFYYGIDEAASISAAQMSDWNLVHANGGKIWVAGQQQIFPTANTALDVVVMYVSGPYGRYLTTAQVDGWHNDAVNTRILGYGSPQAGIENPETYRRTYGLPLYAANYDGAFQWAYQYTQGDLDNWNDWVGPRYRKQSFTYPVTDRPIDTLQWEGVREAVDDTRYIATLDLYDTSRNKSQIITWLNQRLLISGGISTANLTTVRQQIIQEIISVLGSQATNQPPTSTQIGNQVIAKSTSTGPISFTVGDDTTPVGSLTTTALSGNTTLVPNNPANLTFGGSGASRTLSVTPVVGQIGSSTISYSVQDTSGNTTTKSFSLSVTNTTTPPPPSGRFVSVTGISSGPGSITAPWNLPYAFSGAGGQLSAGGETVYMRGGAYVGLFRPTFTPTSPITFKRYPGEQPILDGANLGHDNIILDLRFVDNFTFEGLEVRATPNSRISTQQNIDYSFPTDITYPYGIYIGGSETDSTMKGKHINIYNCVIHDTAQGISLWTSAYDNEVNGCIIYNNGWKGFDRGHGHNWYWQNRNSIGKKAVTCYIGYGFGEGIQGYTADRVLDYLTIQRCILVETGVIVNGQRNILLGGSTTLIQSPVIRDNFSYYRGNPGQGGNVLNIGYDGNGAGAINGVVAGNWFLGGAWKMTELQNFTVTNNNAWTSVEFFSPGTYPNNTYYSSEPTTTQTFVYRCDRPVSGGRGMIVVYNPTSQNTVSVNLSAVGLANGEAYQLRDLENYFGAVVMSGTWNTSNPSLSIPMTGGTAVRPTGSASEYPPLNTPVSTGPKMRCFILGRPSEL